MTVKVEHGRFLCKNNFKYSRLNSPLKAGCMENLKTFVVGAQWLSGRVLDSKEGRRVRASPASLRCVLEQDILILA